MRRKCLYEFFFIIFSDPEPALYGRHNFYYYEGFSCDYVNSSNLRCVLNTNLKGQTNFELRILTIKFDFAVVIECHIYAFLFIFFLFKVQILNNY